ncbi:CIC11C00000000056 [Sungouiella intermedia]|uniref:CIC11C00000000056 n=1 Tax=Sungouiella intermedia TaxID=45354 RepID=A0A1L0C2H1_9ASCO|nr:CIC11C00000000056 [[Candida] intermedia]SGZ57775.1 CIC11C00000005676 [[Candida] intermedia]
MYLLKLLCTFVVLSTTIAIDTFSACPSQNFNWHHQVTNFPKASITVTNPIKKSDGTWDVNINFSAGNSMSVSSLTELKILGIGTYVLYSNNMKIYTITDPGQWSYTVNISPRVVENYSTCMPSFTIQM